MSHPDPRPKFYLTTPIYYANARVIELLIVSAGWYLIIVTILSIGQHFLERYFARGSGRRSRPAAPSAVEG